MEKISDGWLYTSSWEKGFGEAKEVRLPHTVGESPLHYAGPEDYEGLRGYRKILSFSKSDLEQRLFVRFDGAAHIATVFFNGKELLTHRCGYTAFRVELTEDAREGENELTVKLDTTENPSIPPFGFVIDYLTYGGLYRDVWLEKRPRTYLKDVFATTPTTTSLSATYEVDGDDAYTIKAVLLGKDGEPIAEGTAVDGRLTLTDLKVSPWSPDSSVLYTLRSSLLMDGKACDTVDTTIGFRTISFDENSFYLNGKKLFIRGLNRHQCWPYIGYAAPERMQREDARILKEELQVNAVRTSHYPQSHYFLDECDRLGLLVFTEIPGWQHVGDKAWQDQAVENTKEMVLQYRNHPSIFLWGVRINESLDYDDFYARTNETAHTLDPTRPTSGVRYLKKSSLLEDVYAFNDFSHTGKNPGAEDKKAVTPDLKKPLLISEANGHMYPTKASDPWLMRQEQALRHARVLDKAMGDGGHAGCIQWCLFDYATHQDFGSGDRICYHGVLDSFRNPKPAAYLWASQGEKEDVLYLTSSMDIGDYPGGNLGIPYILSNADKVELYKNDKFVTSYTKSEFKALPHGPMAMDDTIGELLVSDEGYSEAMARDIGDCLNSAAHHGLEDMPLSKKLKLAWCMVRYHLKYADGVRLYGKYVGGWGGESKVWVLKAWRNGKEVKELTFSHSTRLHLEVKVGSTTLLEGNGYDETLVRIRVVDEYGNLASYAALPLALETEGPLEICGPRTIITEGGMTGVIVKTTGETGRATLRISGDRLPMEAIGFEVKGDAR